MNFECDAYDDEENRYSGNYVSYVISEREKLQRDRWLKKRDRELETSRNFNLHMIGLFNEK